MSALATGANWVLIPRRPPSRPTGRASLRADPRGRRAAAGTRPSSWPKGPSTAPEPHHSRDGVATLSEKLGLEARTTVLGMSSAAARRAPSTASWGRSSARRSRRDSLVRPGVDARADRLKGNRLSKTPLLECVADRGRWPRRSRPRLAHPLARRGAGFREAFDVFRTLVVRSRTRPGPAIAPSASR